MRRFLVSAMTLIKAAILTVQIACSAQVVYWPSSTPAGETEGLALRPYSNHNIPIEELNAWCESHNWKKDRPNPVFVLFGNWVDYSVTPPKHRHETEAKLYADRNGEVTIESMAWHVRRGQVGWKTPELKSWFAAYLQELKNNGWPVGLVSLDIEGGYITPTSTYYDSATQEPIRGQEVIGFLLENPRYRRGLPSIPAAYLTAANMYGPKENRQAMVLWNHWYVKEMAKALTETFGGITAQVYPDAIVHQYEFSKYQDGPVLDWNSGLPRPSVSVAGNSCPVLYLLDGYKLANNTQALMLLDAVIAGQRNHTVCPWIGGEWREGSRGWAISAADPDRNAKNLEAECIERGCPFVLKF